MGLLSKLVIVALACALAYTVYLLMNPYKPSYLSGSKPCGLLPSTETSTLATITADPAAKWIGTSGATPQTFNKIQLQILYNNTTKTEQAAQITWAVDDNADIYLGSNKLVSGSGGYSSGQTGLLKTTVYFPPGNTLVRFDVNNSGGGRGCVIASCRSTDSGTPLLFSSGSAWQVRDTPA